VTTESKKPDQQSGFRPDVEGLRAVAILLVILYHAHVPGFGGGYIGVDVFFALSGYLITGILAREFRERGRIDFWRFYARRVRRLLPAASLLVLFVLLAGRTLYAPGELWPLATQGVATSLYLSNVPFIVTATDYLAAGQEHSALLHMWSLAVEEQFYLLWPAAVAWALHLRARRGRLGLWPLVALAATSFVLSSWWTRTAPIWAFFAMPARVWEFALGAFAVLIPTSALEAGPRGRFIGWLALAAIVAGAMLFGTTTPFPGVAALIPVLGVACLVRATATAPDLGVGRWLGLASMQTIGRLSYSWYLWHWPLLVFARHRGWIVGAWGGVAVSAFALLLAQLTFVTLESPVRRSRVLTSRPAMAVGIGLAVSMALAGLALGVRQLCIAALDSPDFAEVKRATAATALQDRGCLLSYEATANNSACDFGVEATPTVVLFGDSHAAQWFVGLDAAAKQAGWRLRVRTKSECPSADVTFFSSKLRGNYDACTTWRRQTIAELAAQPGQVVVLTNSRGYLAADGSQEGVSLADWQAGIARTSAELVRTGQRVVVLRDSPRPGIHVPNCLASHDWPWWPAGDSCDVPRAQALDPAIWRAEQAGIAGLTQANTLDLSDEICPGDPCPARAGKTLRYTDSNHLAPPFVATLAPSLRAGLALQITSH
jgi:peptidoglycan/LPS O-acetylase OafA/YrhL